MWANKSIYIYALNQIPTSKIMAWAYKEREKSESTERVGEKSIKQDV